MNALHRLALASVLIVSSVAIAQTPTAAPPAEQAPEAIPAKQRPPIYDEQADAKQQIAAAVARAKKENKRVLIQWGANWCIWCHRLHDLFKSDKDIKKQLLYEYEVVLVDMGEKGKNADIAETYHAQVGGLPYLTVLDADGKVVVSHETASLEKGQAHDPAKVLAFLKEHQAPYLSAENVLNDGLKRAKGENKMVFLHFGAPWCGWCHKLEDWMSRPQIEAIMSKDFVDVKIDVDRTIGGKDLQKRYTKETDEKPKGIPWFALLNAQRGEAMATSDDRDGNNIGFPAKEQEIAHFGEMLRKACRNIPPQQIDELLASLKGAGKSAS